MTFALVEILPIGIFHIYIFWLAFLTFGIILKKIIWAKYFIYSASVYIQLTLV